MEKPFAQRSSLIKLNLARNNAKVDLGVQVRFCMQPATDKRPPDGQGHTVRKGGTTTFLMALWIGEVIRLNPQNYECGMAYHVKELKLQRRMREVYESALKTVSKDPKQDTIDLTNVFEEPKTSDFPITKEDAIDVERSSPITNR
uniref:Uncharacterized protein n=1 Tax=Panagrellus redivivus TaxID=6233 RepID=A0A7E4VPV6_PANRE